MRTSAALLCLLHSLVTLPALAQSLGNCLAMAGGYYEQLYCEIQARGEGLRLPPLYQFKQNNEQTQWLLLKRPATKLGLAIASPRKNPVPGSPAPTTATRAATQAPRLNSPPATQVDPSPPQACALVQQGIVCDQVRYTLQTNRHNRHLSPRALTADNTLDLPAFTGRVGDTRAVRAYLYVAYPHYLDKMRSIGLGGITTSFGKFSYLFYDYHARNIDFVQRFETLFHYLKKDKASLAVSERPEDTAGVQLDDCAPLAERYFVCEHRGKNLLFARN